MIFCHHSNWSPDKYKSLTNEEPKNVKLSGLWLEPFLAKRAQLSQVPDENDLFSDIICLHIKMYLRKFLQTTEVIAQIVYCWGVFCTFSNAAMLNWSSS